MYVLSNTTIWWIYIYIYIYIYIIYYIEKQLHVSVLDNGHLQVVYETFSKQLVIQLRSTLRHNMMPTINLSLISLDIAW